MKPPSKKAPVEKYGYDPQKLSSSISALINTEDFSAFTVRKESEGE